MADVTNIDSYRGGQTPATTRGKSGTTVHCLQIPLYNDTLLLPNAAVAEIIAYVEPEPADDGPEWLIGKLDWRERKVPLISYEIASGGEMPTKTGTRIAIMNTLNSNPRVPYIAIVTQGIPSMKLIQEKHLAVDDEADKHPRPSVASKLVVEGSPVLVPDLDDLEQRIERLHAT